MQGMGDQIQKAGNPDISPLLRAVCQLSSETISSIDTDNRSSVHTDADSNQPPSPMYYKQHFLCSPAVSQASSLSGSQGALFSLQRYCSSVSMRSYLNLRSSQEFTPEFKLPVRKTPPRGAGMTATAELVSYIKRNHSRDYHALIEKEIKQDQIARAQEEYYGPMSPSKEATKSVDSLTGIWEMNGHIE